jgi:HD-GYP domain-containing protein (c-di-GMP phosphodiesterase class II)
VRKVPIEFLLPGMVTGASIYDDDGHLLLRNGVALIESYIERLRVRGFPSVIIDDELTEGVIVADVIKENTRVQAIKQIKETFMLVGDKYSHAKINVAKFQCLVDSIVDELIDNKNIIYNLSDIRSVDNYLFTHSVNVCVLSIMTGLSIGYDRHRLTELALGALLHDIGKARIPYEILNKPGKLTEEEFELLKQHPKYSLDILRSNYSVSSIT